jgi:hypothetical protein
LRTYGAPLYRRYQSTVSRYSELHTSLTKLLLTFLFSHALTSPDPDALFAQYAPAAYRVFFRNADSKTRSFMAHNAQSSASAPPWIALQIYSPSRRNVSPLPPNPQIGHRALNGHIPLKREKFATACSTPAASTELLLCFEHWILPVTAETKLPSEVPKPPIVTAVRWLCSNVCPGTELINRPLH